MGASVVAVTTGFVATTAVGAAVTAVVSTAVIGAVVGGVVSAVSGGDIGKGMLTGGLVGGLAGGAAALTGVAGTLFTPTAATATTAGTAGAGVGSAAAGSGLSAGWDAAYGSYTSAGLEGLGGPSSGFNAGAVLGSAGGSGGGVTGITNPYTASMLGQGAMGLLKGVGEGIGAADRQEEAYKQNLALRKTTPSATAPLTATVMGGKATLTADDLNKIAASPELTGQIYKVYNPTPGTQSTAQGVAA